MNRKQIIFLIFVLAFAIILPFRAGFLTLLDFNAIPWTIININPIQSWVGNIVLDSLRNLLWPWFSQWLLFLGIEFLIWYAIFRLLNLSLKKTDLKNWWILFWVFLAMLSPFAYQRLVEGQYLVIWGWAILFLAVSYLYEYIKLWTKNSLLIYGILSALAVSFSSHAIFFVALISTWVFLKNNNFSAQNFWKNLLKYVWCILIMIALNLNWIIWGILWKSDASQTISQMDFRHIEAFETTGKNVFFHALSMHGFWWEKMGRFALDTGANPSWKILFLMIFWFVLTWLYQSLKNKYNDKTFSSWLLIVSILSFILALWTKSWIFSPLIGWLYQHVPFYIWLREPQKWIGLLVLTYSFFWARGFVELTNYFSKVFELKKSWIWAIFLSLPFLYNPYMLFWLKWQLSVSHYPIYWQDTKNYLHQNLVNWSWYEVLVLPWHQYIKYDFMPKISANPANWYFSDSWKSQLDILVGDNMELKNVYSQSTRYASKIVEKYVWPGWIWEKDYDLSDWKNFVQDMKNLGVKDILVIKQIGWVENEQYLQNLQKDWLVEKIFSAWDISLYKIK